MKYGSKAVPYLVKSVKFLKSVVNVEKHLFDQSVSITSANAGFINCLSFIAAGDDYNNRQGNTCKMNYITIPAGRVIQNGGDSNQVRMLIFMDTANQGTTPAVTDVLASADPNDVTNPDNVKRFWILYDRLFILSANTPARQIKCFKWNKVHLRF